MRTISANLKQDLIDGYRAVLVKVTTNKGVVYGYTDHDVQLTVDSVVYQPTPGLLRGNMSVSSTEQVSNQEFSTAWIDAPEEELLSGLFDNAKIDVLHCSWKNPSYGGFIINSGNLGQIQWNSDGFTADVMGFMRALQKNVNFIATGHCRHLLFSQFDEQHIGACTLNKTSYTRTGTVTGILTDQIKITASGLVTTNQYHTNGVLTWTSGTNSGKSHEIKNHLSSNNSLEFFLPTEHDIQLGETFSITAGCDKTHSTCKSKFNNVINFGGFPHIKTEVQYR